MEIKKVAIIGGGLAGCATAFFLSKENIIVDLFEKDKEIALGASGNDYGVIYPRIELKETRDSIFYKNSFDFLIEFLKEIEDVDYNQCGILIIPQKKERLNKFLEIIKANNKICSYQDLSASENGLFLSTSGYLSPRKLANKLASQPNINIFANREISNIEFNAEIKKWEISYDNNKKLFDSIVIANSFDLNKFHQTKDFIIDRIRGQVSKIASEFIKYDLKHVICKDCYLIPSMDGHFHFGASFERGSDSLEVTQKSHMSNIAKLNQIIESLNNMDDKTRKDFNVTIRKGNLSTLPINRKLETGIEEDLQQFFKDKDYIDKLEGKAGFRAYSGDKMPIIGDVKDHKELYINACHGSRGILSAIYGGLLLSKLMNNNLNSKERIDLETVTPNRLLLYNRYL